MVAIDPVNLLALTGSHVPEAQTHFDELTHKLAYSRCKSEPSLDQLILALTLV